MLARTEVIELLLAFIRLGRCGVGHQATLADPPLPTAHGQSFFSDGPPCTWPIPWIHRYHEAFVDQEHILNATTDLGWTPLMLASRRRRSSVVHILLSNGADPNLRDKTGKPALVYAAEGSDDLSGGDVTIVTELMWSGSIPVQRNPMELVTVKGATKRLRKPRRVTVTEFQKFIAHLAEPFRTLALLSVSFGLRISEALALKWNDVDWVNQTLNIE
jgi:integrase